MYKVYIKKDIEVRGVEYTKGESYEVSLKIYRILICIYNLLSRK